MEYIPYFKRQSKNLLKDFETRCYNEEKKVYEYKPKFFDISSILMYFDYPDDKPDFRFTLMNAQHLIAKMVGYDNWDGLIHATETEQALAEFLLHRFKSAEDIQYWKDTISFAFADAIREHGMEVLNAETLLDYAQWHYELGDRKEIVHLPMDRISVLTGKLKQEALSQFDDEHNPAGSLRLDSYVFCTHCKKAFDFKQSKVIKDSESNLTMVVCKNHPKCKGTYLDFKVLTPTVLYGEARTMELEKGARMFSRDPNSQVHCIHCDQQYNYNEAKAVIDPDDGEVYIHCKNYPECDGDLLDMMPINITDNSTEK